MGEGGWNGRYVGQFEATGECAGVATATEPKRRKETTGGHNKDKWNGEGGWGGRKERGEKRGEEKRKKERKQIKNRSLKK